MPFMMPTRTGKVEWWDHQYIYVRCPRSNEIHKSPFRGYGAQTCQCDCYPRPTLYRPEFPLGSDSGYEIDKKNFRFVAAGAEPPDPMVDVEPLASRVCRVLSMYDRSLTNVGSFTSEAAIRQGDVSLVREWIESPDERLSVHSLYSSELTSGLHIAAREESLDMVEMFLSHDANLDAINLEGRTPLMEAALWGRLENVKMLLKYNANKDVQCSRNYRLIKAVDFARPWKEHAKERWSRSSKGNTEDTYARDCDREDIVRILEDEASDSTLQLELTDFAFHRSSDPSTSVSLTMKFSPVNERKTIAVMLRGGRLDNVEAKSGWSHLTPDCTDIEGENWIEAVYDLCNQFGHQLEPDYRDRGEPGRFFACHAEKQLIAYYFSKHDFSEQECEGTDLDEVTNRLLELSLKDGEDAERRERMRELRAIRPSQLLLSPIIIMSSRIICEDCQKFVERVNASSPFQFRLIHRCIDDTCVPCSSGDMRESTSPLPTKKPRKVFVGFAE